MMEPKSGEVPLPDLLIAIFKMVTPVGADTIHPHDSVVHIVISGG